MKINEISLINYSPRKINQRKEINKNNSNFTNFSSNYCFAIKSYNLSFMGEISEEKIKQDFYNHLKNNPNNKEEDIKQALEWINTENHKFLREFYQFFEDEGRLNLKQINYIYDDANWDYTAEQKIKAYKDITAQEDLTTEELVEIIKHIVAGNNYTKFGLELFKQYPNFPQELKVFLLADIASLSYIQDEENREDFYLGAREFSSVYKKLMTNPELYINGEAENKAEAQEEVKEFVQQEFETFVMLSHLFGAQGMEQLCRKRFDALDEFMYKYNGLDWEYASFLEKLLDCEKIDGSEFSINEKINLVNIVASFNVCATKIDRLEEKIKDGKVDLEELEKFLLKETFKVCGMKKGEIKQVSETKLNQWDLNYISQLAILKKQMENEEDDNTLANLIRVANSDIDFRDYLHEDNEYGVVNFSTKELFKNTGLNYEAWLNPDESLEVQFKYVDSNQEKLSQIISQIEEDIEFLRKTPAKNFIDKHYSDCISNNKFKINEKYSKDRKALETFVKNMFELLDKNIFSRAQENLNNPNKKQNAQNTLTIKNHLEQRLKDISQCKTTKKEKPIDLTIKMWDRNPIYDLFQGNYSTCCISLDGENSSAMPHYLLNTAFNMIELVDNKTGKTIGNALCYFVLDENDEPRFIIDNIEIANSHKMSDKASSELLNQILGYCINLVQSITPKNIQILMGTSYNDVYDEEESTIKVDYLKLLGEIDCEDIYMDALGGWGNGEYDFNYSKNKEKLELIYLADSRDDFFVDDDLDECY